MLSNNEYEGFLAGVTEIVEAQVAGWRVQLGEACAEWRNEGYATAVLERAMLLEVRPDVTGLLAAFSAAVEHLQTLEVQAAAVDPTLLGRPPFRNPEAVSEAQRLVDEALASQKPAPVSPPAAHATRVLASEGGALDTFFLDAEKVVWEWPDFSGRVIEEFR